MLRLIIFDIIIKNIFLGYCNPETFENNGPTQQWKPEETTYPFHHFNILMARVTGRFVVSKMTKQLRAENQCQK